MIILNKEKTISSNSLNVCLRHSLVAFLITVSIALLIHDIWIRNMDLYHSILEISCVFIALATFISVWFTFSQKVENNHIIGFGYLSVAVFDVLHTYYFLHLNLETSSYFDLSTRYWILGRLTEALVMLLAIKGPRLSIGKWRSFAGALLPVIAAAYFVKEQHDFLPVLLTASGVTPLKAALEYFIISVYLYSLISLRSKLDEKGIMTYKYIFIALLLSTAAEFCFTLYSSVENISWTVGHMLKIISYFYLFRGVFVSTVIYPYGELQRKNNELEDKNFKLNSMSESMSQILDAMPIAVLKYDKQGELEYINKKFAEILEYEREELLRAEGGHLTSAAVAVSGHNEERGGDIQAFTARTGKYIKLSRKIHEIKDGKLVLLSETKKEQELQNLHIQTETIFASVSSGVLVIDQEMKIVLCNNSFERIFEVERAELLGMHIESLNEMINSSRKDLPHKVLYDELKEHEYQVKITSLKGNEKEVLLYVAPIRNIDGEIIGAICIGTDVTEQKREQQRMLQQEKLALLGQMGAAIVHETRNFLTTIKGRCQLIDMLTKDESIKRHAAKINNDVEEVNRIISEFLFLSKPRDTEFYEISIHDVFASIRSMVETSSLVKGVDIEFRFTEQERYINCDEAQLKQVILNICKNAIDAMSGRENAKLLIETGYDEASNDMYISITDNGKGIAEEDLEKLGTPFYTTKSNGTGLGLSVCFKIVEEHGGRIEVDSVLERGTTFKIYLPCIEEEELD